jgi:hypothetical protein
MFYTVAENSPFYGESLKSTVQAALLHYLQQGEVGPSPLPRGRLGGGEFKKTVSQSSQNFQKFSTICKKIIH